MVDGDGKHIVLIHMQGVHLSHAASSEGTDSDRRSANSAGAEPIYDSNLSYIPDRRWSICKLS